MDKLLPCPFCGGAMQIGTLPGPRYFWFCSECEIDSRGVFSVRDEAVSDANRREPAPPPEAVKGGAAPDIEKAAREYVAARKKAGAVRFGPGNAGDAFDADAAEDAAWTNLCVAVDGWAPTQAEAVPAPARGPVDGIPADILEHEYRRRNGLLDRPEAVKADPGAPALDATFLTQVLGWMIGADSFIAQEHPDWAKQGKKYADRLSAGIRAMERAAALPTGADPANTTEGGAA